MIRRNLKQFICWSFIVIFLLTPISTEAKLELVKDNDGREIQRSLESLRDLDYQTWQVVAYPQLENSGHMV